MSEPKQAHQHPAIELEAIVENIQSIDDQRVSLLEQRRADENKARDLIQTMQKMTESALFTVEGPTKEDADEERTEQEHWESVRERRRNGA